MSTTNNRMELTAAIEALAALTRSCDVELYTDSQYLRQGITEWLAGWVRRGWLRANGSPVENGDLWKSLAAQAERHTVRWRWLRGHQGHRWNERADALATEARRSRGRRAQSQQATISLGKGQRSAEPESEPSPPELRRFDLYCRASALDQAAGPAGYGAVLVAADGTTIERAGAWPLATGNQMELWAVVAGLQALPRRSTVTVHTPSKYVLEGAARWLAGWERNGWRTSSGQPVQNREIWQELSAVMGDHDVHWKHQPAGASQRWADRAAELARQYARAQRDSSSG